ncbi:hypothetical protein BHE74_00007314 [Ensete ventricosum]|nr:hypothetical protein BHE74_00007314 [Ensete ventricosum]RZR87777.1 hypothetical protein BHM03_00015249 [Ensete ventricosum]
MARVEGATICLLIVAMDVVAGVLGIKAEEAESKLGLAATALLALSHAFANVLGGCPSNGRSRSTPFMVSIPLIFHRKADRACTSLMFINLIRIVVIVGLTMLIMGAVSNSESRATCGLAHPRFLFLGGIICFVHALFCIVYYVSSIASWKEGKAHRDTRSQGSHA